MSYYDQAPDLPTSIKDEDAERIWVTRVKQLKKEGIFVKSYSDLRTSMDDGVPEGSVRVVVVENSREDSYRLSFIFAGSYTRGFKIQEIFPRDSELEQAISGNTIWER